MWECLLWSCHGFLHPVCTGILRAGPFLLPERGEDYGISHGDLPWHPLTLLGGVAAPPKPAQQEGKVG